MGKVLMDLDNRRTEIMNLLSERGYMTVNELSDITGCSVVTIRSDLSVLEQRGLLFRTHGGATRTEKKGAFRALSNTMTEYETEKQKIAKKAASLISDGSTIFIDSGSTTIRLVPYIKDMNITVVTNSMPVADSLMTYENINLVVIGGVLRKATMATVGSLANSAVKSINVDFYFMGSAGFNDDSITSSDLSECEIKQMVISSADHVVYMADHSKYGKKAFARVCSWNSVGTFVTDAIDPELNDMLLKQGIDILIPEN